MKGGATETSVAVRHGAHIVFPSSFARKRSPGTAIDLRRPGEHFPRESRLMRAAENTCFFQRQLCKRRSPTRPGRRPMDAARLPALRRPRLLIATSRSRGHGPARVALQVLNRTRAILIRHIMAACSQHLRHALAPQPCCLRRSHRYLIGTAGSEQPNLQDHLQIESRCARAHSTMGGDQFEQPIQNVRSTR